MAFFTELLPGVINDYRIVPRIAVAFYIYTMHQVALWIMALPDPTATQVGFASTVWGAAPFFFNFYMNKGSQHHVTASKRYNSRDHSDSIRR